MSPLEIAQNARDIFSRAEEEAKFAFIHDAQLDLLALAKHPGQDPCLQMAAFALAGFGERILDDLTRAVPWDEKAALGQTRKQALELLKASFQLMEDVDRGDAIWARFFCEMGKLRSQYEALIDHLNDRDRELLSELSGA